MNDMTDMTSTPGALEKDFKSVFEEENYDFSVTNPKLQGDNIIYYIKGIDKLGAWEGYRRYSHFFALYETLL